VAARFEARVKAVMCSGPGSRTVGGSGMTCLGRWKRERERECRVEKLLSAVKESAGHKILGQGT
jgi:hypothetical protein